MADIETYGGCCPHCAKPMLQKNDPHSTGWFKYDACPWCGFAYGTVNGEELFGRRVWDAIFSQNKMPMGSSLKDLTKDLGLKQQTKTEDDFSPSVFNYNNDTPEQLESYRSPGFTLVPDTNISVTDVLTHIDPTEFLVQRQTLLRVATQDGYVLNTSERSALKALFVTIEHLTQVAGNMIGFDVTGEKP